MHEQDEPIAEPDEVPPLPLHRYTWGVDPHADPED